MLHRVLLAALALGAAAAGSEAGPFRRSARPVYQPVYQPAFPPAYPQVYQPPAFPPTVVTASAESASGAAPTAVPAAGVTTMLAAPAGGLEGDGLAEVNAQRAMRGLPPYVRDEGLTQAAFACARFRAAHGLFGHTANDFAFVPPGAFATSAGCAAYPAGLGWMSCCVYENHTFAGAAWVTGPDGRRYMHLFVR